MKRRPSGAYPSTSPNATVPPVGGTSALSATIFGRPAETRSSTYLIPQP